MPHPWGCVEKQVFPHVVWGTGFTDLHYTSCVVSAVSRRVRGPVARTDSGSESARAHRGSTTALDPVYSALVCAHRDDLSVRCLSCLACLLDCSSQPGGLLTGNSDTSSLTLSCELFALKLNSLLGPLQNCNQVNGVQYSQLVPPAPGTSSKCDIATGFGPPHVFPAAPPRNDDWPVQVP